jgi:general nucleoside transport system permease protein
VTQEPQAGQALAGEPGPEGAAVTPTARLAAYLQAGGIVVPVLTAVLAFFIAGLVIFVTGHNPFSTYKAIFNGTGLNWLFPWISSDDRTTAALNLQQTLIITTPLILTGLAVAFAFRCGLFNIGGQGQYFVGTFAAVWVGSSFADMPKLPHILLAVVAATLAGAAWAAIAGLLKATVGAHEVISTIMLNWIAIWVGSYLFALHGPLQNTDPSQQSVPVSNDVAASAKLPVFWGDPELQGLHVGLFIALAAVLVFWVILNRSTTGYEVRAVGLNPEAARYGGINVGRNYVLVMAVCGAFAGLAGSMDILGWEFHVATNNIPVSQVGFFGIAVALLGRNTASGTAVAALLFGALLSGTSQRNLDPTIFEPELASNLTTIIQGLVVLIVSADVIVLSMVRRGQRMFPRRGPAVPSEEVEAA